MSSKPGYSRNIEDQPSSSTVEGVYSEGPWITSPVLHDVIIIGAGPCGLAVAARLCEHTPSAIFTDEEHQRYHWIRKHGRKMSIMKGKGGCVVLARPPGAVVGDVAAGGIANTHRPEAVRSGSRRNEDAHHGGSSANVDPPKLGHSFKTLVLDATADEWMANWNRLFKLFEITHLRSPMFFHVDPRDRDGLLAYTYERQRKDELREIRDCVGKEVSKHKKKKKQAERMSKESGHGPKARLEIDERDRKDYYVPSHTLFSNHCECIVDRYGLNAGLIRKENVLDIDFGSIPSISQTEDVFSITTNKGTHYARAVVAAVGAGNPPKIPDTVASAQMEEGMCHSNHIKEFPARSVRDKIRAGNPTNVLVVGGGLTSAQLDDLAIRRGVSKVWHIMRSDLKESEVKPFDVNLEWMGKFKNHEKAIFWSADTDEERLEQIRAARNGGSITPTYHKILKSHIVAGRVSLHTQTTLSSRLYDPTTRTWAITTNPPIADLPAIDYIYFATGIAPDFSTLPFLQTMLRKFPLHGHGGFPCLSEDLMWRGTADGKGVRARQMSDKSGKTDKMDNGAVGSGVGSSERVPLFVTGRLASLRLGPGAGNLEGARVGAERIAWALQEVLADTAAEPGSSAGAVENEAESEIGDEAAETETDDSMYKYCAGIGSRYERLGSVGDEF